MLTYRRERLGQLDCVIADDAQQTPQIAVVLMHGFGAPGDDLVSLAEELVACEPSIAGHVRFVFPAALLQPPELADFVRRHERVYVVEQNRDAQLLALMRLEFDPELIARLRSVRYYGGLPLDARTITDDVVRQEEI